MPNHHAVIVANGARVVARHYSQRIERLFEEGFIVHVAAADDGGFGLLPPETLARPVPAGLSAAPAAFVLLQAHFIEHEPLLVHGIGTPMALLAALAASRVDTPAIFSTVEHHLCGDDAQFPPLAASLRTLGIPVDGLSKRIYGWLAEWSDRYVTTTEEDLRIAEAWTPGQKLDLAVGGRGADVGRLNPHDSELEDVGSVRGRLFDSQKRHVIGALVDEEGGLGLGELAKFVRKLALERPDTLFALGVDRFAGARVEAAARKIDAPWEVVAVDDELSFMRALDLFVMTRRLDSRGGGAMMASACARPIVAQDSRHAREVVVSDQTGLIVSADELGKAVMSLLDDPARLRRFGVRARTRAVERFDRRQVDDQMLRLYDNVLRGKLA